LDTAPHDAEFDDFLLHVDGWLCQIKDAQIRDGLHVLGIAERLLEAADRKLWDAPDPDTLAALRQAYLETEGDLENR
jgi:cobalamin biosynthesis Mg chelatase CobN